MKIQPIGDKILIKTFEKELQTKSGILLVSSQDKEENFATVVAIGGKVEEIKVGDKIIYENFNAEKITDDETKEEFYLLESRRVLAILI